MKAKLVKESQIYSDSSLPRYGSKPMGVYEDGDDIWKDVRFGGKDKPKNTLAYDPRIVFSFDEWEHIFIDELTIKYKWLYTDAVDIFNDYRSELKKIFYLGLDAKEVASKVNSTDIDITAENFK